MLVTLDSENYICVFVYSKRKKNTYRRLLRYRLVLYYSRTWELYRALRNSGAEKKIEGNIPAIVFQVVSVLTQAYTYIPKKKFKCLILSFYNSGNSAIV